MIKKHLEHFDPRKISTITSVAFFVAMQAAMLAYASSTFLQKFIRLEHLGYFYVATNLCSIIIILFLTRVIKKIGRYKTFLIFFIINIFSLISLSIFLNPVIGIFSFLVYFSSLFAIYNGIHIFTETFSQDCSTGQTIGRQLTISNMAWVIAPIISGYLLSAYSFQILFIISAMAMMVALTFFAKLGGDYDQNNHNGNIKKTWQQIIANKKISNITYISLCLEIFFGTMVIYLPIYMQRIGLNWQEIGTIFTVMIISFVIFQYPAGVLADTKYGERRILLIGFFLVSITSSLVFFLDQPMVWVWMALLFANRTGACLIQVMCESYFCKQIDGRDVHLINFFHLMKPVGVMLATIVASVVLHFYSLPYLFLLLGVFMFLGIFFVRRMDDGR